MAGSSRRLIRTSGQSLAGLPWGLPAALAVVLAGVSLSGCASSHAASLARQACGYVTKAERFQRQADAASGPEAQALTVRATRQLELGEPLAALAAGDDGTWQALQANLAEATHLPNDLILPGLRADCAGIGAAGG
ncbi:MAG: hypothetical protein ACLQK4_15640 [Acidimicrobiales bacterium]